MSISPCSSNVLLTVCTPRLAYRAGVTVGVTAPATRSFLSGLSVAFNTGSPHKLAPSGVVQELTALHVTIDSLPVSVSTQIAVLRNLLEGGAESELKSVFASIVHVRHSFSRARTVR